MGARGQKYHRFVYGHAQPNECMGRTRRTNSDSALGRLGGKSPPACASPRLQAHPPHGARARRSRPGSGSATVATAPKNRAACAAQPDLVHDYGGRCTLKTAPRDKPRCGLLILSLLLACGTLGAVGASGAVGALDAMGAAAFSIFGWFQVTDFDSFLFLVFHG